jgi:hypothetical protein
VGGFACGKDSPAVGIKNRFAVPDFDWNRYLLRARSLALSVIGLLVLLLFAK